MKLDEKKVEEMLKVLNDFKSIDIFECIDEKGGYDDIMSEAKSEEQKEAAMEFAKGLSDHFSKQIQEIIKAMATKEGIENFCNVLNKRYEDNGNR